MSKEFVTIGNVRIKRSNIKTFGISSKERTEGGGGAAYAIGSLLNGKGFFSGLRKGYFPSTVTERYLYVTTFQNDNYTFSEKKIDIDAAVKLLEG